MKLLFVFFGVVVGTINSYWCHLFLLTTGAKCKRKIPGKKQQKTKKRWINVNINQKKYWRLMFYSIHNNYLLIPYFSMQWIEYVVSKCVWLTRDSAFCFVENIWVSISIWICMDCISEIGCFWHQINLLNTTSKSFRLCIIALCNPFRWAYLQHTHIQ